MTGPEFWCVIAVGFAAGVATLLFWQAVTRLNTTIRDRDQGRRG